MSIRLPMSPMSTGMNLQDRLAYEAMGARLVALEDRIVSLETEVRALKMKEEARQQEVDMDEYSPGDPRAFRSCESGPNSEPSFA